MGQKAQITKIGRDLTAFIIGMAGVQALTKQGRECVSTPKDKENFEIWFLGDIFQKACYTSHS